MTPCHGLYADVDLIADTEFTAENSKDFQLAVAEYQKFKNGYEKDVTFPSSLASK